MLTQEYITIPSVLAIHADNRLPSSFDLELSHGLLDGARE